MHGHPGGEQHTLEMLERSGLKPPAKILDMGAGSGQTMKLLHSLGFDVRGIDLFPSAPPEREVLITQGDFLNPPYSENTFDGIISQCAFYVSAHVPKAFLSAYKLLKPGGILMLSDVCPVNASFKEFAECAGFEVLYFEDQTPAWKEYYIEAIWRGTACPFPCSQKMNYEMLICKKQSPKEELLWI